MKKWWGFTAVASLVLVGAGLWGSQHLFHQKITAKDVHVDDHFFDFSDILKESAIKNSVSSKINSSQVSTDDGSSKQAMLPYELQSQETAYQKSNIPMITEEAIRSKYDSTFERLRNVANTHIDQLFANALAEYKQSKKDGRPSVSEIASKYSSAANKLQDAVDMTFYQLLGQMKTDLNQAGLSTDLTVTAEKEYKASIQQKKSELLAKAMKQ